MDSKYFIPETSSVKYAIEKLNELKANIIIFVLNENGKLIGSVTDGDIRRGLLKDINLNENIRNVVQENPKYIDIDNVNLTEIIELRDSNFKLIPITKNDIVIDLLDFSQRKTILPVDVVIMAGGKGSRLKPLTESVPKPLLQVGDKAIIQHNLDRLLYFGVRNIIISVNYLKEKIYKYFKDHPINQNLSFISEEKPLGTIGAVSQIENFENEYVLLTNSDLLTNLDYEDFVLNSIKEDADMAIVTTPYKVDIPYAILEKNRNGLVTSFKEKPTYSYMANAGIYLIKRKYLKLIPKDTFYNTTDLLQKLISEKKRILSYNFSGYWLDIGKHEDFNRAKEELPKINFK